MGLWRKRRFERNLGGVKMEDYLKGYLDVLPEPEKRKVSEIIKSNQEVMSAIEYSEEELERAIEQLITKHKQLSKFLPQNEILDSQKHNEFFTNLYIDLNLLFLESDLIESALSSYNRLYEGILSDLRREIIALRQRVESLRLTSESENGIIVKSFHFSSDNEMEIYGESNAHLFLDRDGSEISPVTIERNWGDNRIILSKNMEEDRLRDKNGNVTAKIQIVDRRGIPVSHPGESLYSIDKAIDNSNETYWAEVVLVDEPIRTKIIK